MKNANLKLLTIKTIKIYAMTDLTNSFGENVYKKGQYNM